MGQNQRLCNAVRPKFPRPGPQPFCLKLSNYSEDVLVSKLSSGEAKVKDFYFVLVTIFSFEVKYRYFFIHIMHVLEQLEPMSNSPKIA